VGAAETYYLDEVFRAKPWDSHEIPLLFHGVIHKIHKLVAL